VEAVTKLTSTVSDLQKENKKLKAERFSGGAQSLGETEKIGALEFVHHDFGEADQESVAGWVDNFKGKNKSTIAVGVGIIKGKRTFIASASKAANKAGIDCGKLFGAIVRDLGGRGGGKEAFARGGLPDNVAYGDFIAAVKDELSELQG
jgi:alanyl-tRNA synthetase